MERVAGVDTSLTSTGIGIITRRADGSCIAATTTLLSRGKRADGLGERLERIDTLAAEIDQAVGPVLLAVIEAQSHGSKGGSPVDRAHLWMSVVARLIRRGVPVAVCAPATRAKFATGTGRADKAAVSAAVTRLWPDVTIANSDEADALVLAHTGAAWSGWPVQTLARHHDALPAIQWPASPRGEIAS